MIHYPPDDRSADWARSHQLPLPALMRDIARLVEVLNLRESGFFSERSVLAGSMALRAYNSPRFTIYDTDLSTESAVTPSDVNALLAYEDDDIKITPVATTPTSDAGGVWRAKPVRFEPYFSRLSLTDEDKQFAVDVSQYGVLRDGREMEVLVPYGDALGIWPRGGPASVYVMALEEICAEKILGWCAYGRVKHYADLGFIAGAYSNQLKRDTLRAATADKLAVMRRHHPGAYEGLDTLEDLVEALRPPVELPDDQWASVNYITHAFTREQIQELVERALLPLLSGETP